MTKPKDKNAQLVAKYLSTRKILIADTNPSSRSGLSRALVQLGAKLPNIAMAQNFEDAHATMGQIKPQVVFADYDLQGGCGLNLLQAQRANDPDSKNHLFFLVTGNTSQSAVAQAAEEDVDMYILKPFTIDNLTQSVVKAALAKVYPTDYAKKINEGKQLMFEMKIDEAVEVFQAAMKMDPKPALACFYHGQAMLMKKSMEEAQSDYDKGLNYNKIHYKCLVGLFELLMSRKQFKEAYDVVKKLSRYFPANPQRLTQVLRLAVMVKAFDDIERYYQSFTTIETRNEELIKYICAALVVCGKFYLQQGHNKRGFELFEKAGVTAAGRSKVLREVITALCQFGFATEAQPFLKRFPPAVHKAADFQACGLLIADTGGQPASATIDQARKILQSGVEDPMVYTLLIKRSMQMGLKDSAESLSHTAAKTFPEYQKEFQKALETKPDADKKAA